MQTQDFVKPTGTLNIVLTDEHGVVKMNVTVPNLVVTTGKTWLAARMANTSLPAQMSYMAVGQSTQAAAIGDTALYSEAGRAALTTAGGTPSGTSTQFNATFSPGVGTGSLTEAAILNASSAGTMLARTVFGVVTKGVNDTVSLTWNVTMS